LLIIAAYLLIFGTYTWKDMSITWIIPQHNNTRVISCAYSNVFGTTQGCWGIRTDTYRLQQYFGWSELEIIQHYLWLSYASRLFILCAYVGALLPRFDAYKQAYLECKADRISPHDQLR
jgi:hypothetical protein